MDTDEHRLTVDFYLCEFVFICGCLRRFRSEASTVPFPDVQVFARTVRLDNLNYALDPTIVIASEKAE